MSSTNAMHHHYDTGFELPAFPTGSQHFDQKKVVLPSRTATVEHVTEIVLETKAHCNIQSFGSIAKHRLARTERNTRLPSQACSVC